MAQRDELVWAALWSRRSVGRIAVAVNPSKERVERQTAACEKSVPARPRRKPVGYSDRWRASLVAALANMRAGQELPGDAVPAVGVPRFTHGQSQGICDIFGARVEELPDGNFHVHPLPPDPEAVRRLTPKPLETSMYWNAVPYTRYAREIIGPDQPIRNPVMVGPLDTANYLLGTQTLLEWLHTEPETVRALLDRITEVIEAFHKAWQDAAGGRTATHHLRCMTGGFDFCSECRSLISREAYETFEAPCLRRLGERLGPYAIHSCGSWERTVPSALADPNLRAMNGQVRENDLELLCRLSKGGMTFSIGRSVNVHEHLTWPDAQSFYEYVLRTVPPSQPLELAIAESYLGEWNGLCAKTGRRESSIS